jgi:hypothetical protein
MVEERPLVNNPSMARSSSSRDFNPLGYWLLQLTSTWFSLKQILILNWLFQPINQPFLGYNVTLVIGRHERSCGAQSTTPVISSITIHHWCSVKFFSLSSQKWRNQSKSDHECLFIKTSSALNPERVNNSAEEKWMEIGVKKRLIRTVTSSANNLFSICCIGTKITVLSISNGVRLTLGKLFGRLGRATPKVTSWRESPTYHNLGVLLTVFVSLKPFTTCTQLFYILFPKIVDDVVSLMWYHRHKWWANLCFSHERSTLILWIFLHNWHSALAVLGFLIDLTGRTVDVSRCKPQTNIDVVI